MSNKYDWEVVVEEMGRRIVVSDFSTEQGRFHKDTDLVIRDRIDFHSSIHRDADSVSVREKGTYTYRLVVEIKGNKEYADIKDDMPLSVIYGHIQTVRQAYRSYEIPASIWLEKNMNGS